MKRSTSSSARPRGRPGRALGGAAAALATVFGSLVVGASGAAAAPMTNTTPVPLASASADLGGYALSGTAATLPPTSINLNVTATATWTGSLTTAVGWDSNQVRQGATLAVTRVAPANAGSIDVEWTVTGDIDPLGFGDISIGTINLSNSDVACGLSLSGAGYTCTDTSDSVHLIQTPGIPLSPYVDMAIQVTFDVSPTGAVVGRGFTINGTDAASPTNLSLTDSTQTESFAVPCSSPAGDSVSYALRPFDWTPSVSAAQQPVVQIGLMDPILGVGELPALVDAPFGPEVDTTPPFDLNGTGETVDLGSLLPNNVAPTIAPFGTFDGTEGSPVSFSASTTSQCPISSYVWNFSDGTTAYGPSPQHTFNDGGVFTGQLTVTDETGLSATRNFTVEVADAAPSVYAGPDTTAAWGRPVSFNGQAVAAGSDDQSTLQYTWSFGDGSPSASGGPNALHSYAAPGTYPAQLTVCSEDGLCGSSTRQVNVTRRDTTTAYTGDTSGIFDTPGTLAASVVDAFGSPVSGADVVFQVGTDGPFSAATGATGSATRSYTPTQGAGSYNASATYAGSALYNASSSPTNQYSEVRKATKVTYTGPTSAKPNKAVPLTATLKDATGKALANKTVTFTLGHQTITAVTNGNGVASATLTLNQHVGNYSLSATYAGDASDYVGSSAVTSFYI